MTWNEIINLALEEDLGTGDITTDYLDLEPIPEKAFMIAKAPGIVAGLEIAKEVFCIIDKNLKITMYKRDGDTVKRGDEILRVEGNPTSILKGERTALNFLQRLSGIATMTKAMVDKLEGTSARLLDTRKTTPLLRSMEKYAVRVGGGYNHRFGLYDMILLKDNHIKACGSITEAVKRVKEKNITYKIEVEVSNIKELEEAVRAGVDRILLDNMSIPKIKNCVKRFGSKVDLEVSGGITLENIREIAQTGVPFISSGALTHSYHSLDISLQFKE
ncbi:MAG: carboxylating nicotinate-nucleotide diphosphorylase [Candidatus Cloacimonadaceae bacterium]|jgi:nicotinate-nucleotide pyrophosphorylase (carboxylating)|nr:carboxylating nicotinate-nucleotide diphosphorylase [Candidatus Cloacimonadota bacterium]MCB5257898.1 carboxylating nicotinate-nucleotide diphosphorylase [Candidatus Cloacimonadota bacterium]MDD5625169.1 carboxylating nicotinate-nucleotide diphosphorylase [Candidatus Cloacimonadota bacterium]MDY0112222.1 carboxylating nicotinate-nucleotide diphosphorylase [Candidatus Syntrophosphaera sp.]